MQSKGEGRCFRDSGRENFLGIGPVTGGIIKRVKWENSWRWSKRGRKDHLREGEGRYARISFTKPVPNSSISVASLCFNLTVYREQLSSSLSTRIHLILSDSIERHYVTKA